jgi:hypothetical protein
MKTKNLLGVLLLFTFTFISCDKEDEEGRKITDYKEYVLTVASEMKPGVIWSEGRDYLKEVYPAIRETKADKIKQNAKINRKKSHKKEQEKRTK